MPQIAQLAETYASQFFWLLIFFGFTFFVIGRGMVPKVMATVEARDTQIAADLAAAQAARDEADRQEEAWRVRENENRANAQAVLAKAKADAAVRTEQRLGKAQAKIDTSLAEADGKAMVARRERMAKDKIAAAEREAIQSVRNRAVTAATAASRKLIAEKHGEDADRLLADQVIAGL